MLVNEVMGVNGELKTAGGMVSYVPDRKSIIITRAWGNRILVP